MTADTDYIYSDADRDLIEGPFTTRRSKTWHSLAKRGRALRRACAPEPGRMRERIVEIPLVLAAMSKLPAGSRVADLGGASSLMGLQMAYLDLEVHLLDLRPYPMRHPQLHPVVGDLFESDLPADRFAAISCISVIEHAGVERYGGSARADGDVDMIRELARITQPGGFILLSAPYGVGHDPAADGPPAGYRIYNRERLDKLCQGLEVADLRFYAIDQGVWLRCDQSQADRVPTSRPIDAIIFAQLTVKK